MPDLYQPHTHTIQPGAGEELISIHDLGGLTESEIRQLINAAAAPCGDGTDGPGTVPPPGVAPVPPGNLPNYLEEQVFIATQSNIVHVDDVKAGLGDKNFSLILDEFTVQLPDGWISGDLLVSSSTHLHDSYHDPSGANTRPLTAVHGMILLDDVIKTEPLFGPADMGNDLVYTVTAEKKAVSGPVNVKIKYRHSKITTADIYIDPVTHLIANMNVAAGEQPKDDGHGRWVPDWDNWYQGFGSHNGTFGFITLSRTA